MKKMFSVAMVLALTLALTSAALAAVPAPGGPFNSAFRVQNLEDTDANCSVSFFNPDGSTELTFTPPDPVAPGDSLYVYVPDPALGLAEGDYSAVVSCDKKVAAVTNFSDAGSGAAHEGITEPAPVWYAPGIYDNFYTYFSNIVVQNASLDDVDIVVEVYAPGTGALVLTQESAAPVAPNAATFFEQNNTALAQNVSYSAKISGFVAGTDTPANIAPIVNIYGSGGTAEQLYSYNPFKSGSDVAYAPVLYNKYYTYDTSLTIQNLGTNTAEVQVTYTGANLGSPLVQDYDIPALSSEPLYTPASGLPAGNFLYAAKVESTNGEPIVLLVNESNPNSRAASYTGFAVGAEEATAPFVFKNFFTFDSSVNCQNLGDAPTVMTITYAEGIPGGSTDTPDPIQPGENWMFYQPSDPALASVPINFQTSATITAAQPIVCVVNYDFIPAKAGEILDQLYSYEAIAP